MRACGCISRNASPDTPPVCGAQYRGEMSNKACKSVLCVGIVRHFLERSGNAVKDEGKTGQDELCANVLGKHGTHPPQDPLHVDLVSPMSKCIDNFVCYILSITQNEESQYGDSEEPGSVCRDRRCGLRATLKKSSDKVMVVAQPRMRCCSSAFNPCLAPRSTAVFPL